MADTLGLSDVSSKDTGRGSQLKTGGGRRKHNMPKECVNKLMKAGKSRAEAEKKCYSGMKKTQKPIQTKQQESDLMGLAKAKNARMKKRLDRQKNKKY